MALAQAISGPGDIVGQARIGSDPLADLPFLPSKELQAEAEEATQENLPVPEVIEGLVEGDEPIDPDGFKALYGYKGPAFNPSVQSGQIEVLTDTIGERAGGTWHVLGLARNQTADVVGEVKVTAELRSASGTVLGEVSATSPVRGVRKGEPVPFELQSDIPRADVADVRYSAAPVAGGAVDRRFDVEPAGQVAYDTHDVSSAYPGLVSPGRPYPYVLDLTARNLSDQASRISTVVAWLDHGPTGERLPGRVIAIGSLDPVRGTGPDDPLVVDTEPAAANGGPKGLVYVSTDPEIAPRLSDAEPIFWSGSKTS